MDGHEIDQRESSENGQAPSWAGWVAWTWVVLLVAAVLAEVLDIENLRLALDFGRHLR